MDEDRRADYDSLIGFSGKAINPFRDTSFEANQVHYTPFTATATAHSLTASPRPKLQHPLSCSTHMAFSVSSRQCDDSMYAVQVFVDEISCIGCTNCVGVCPRTFQMQWDEHGRARAIRQGTDTETDLQEALDTCPVNCIHW